MLTQGSIAGAMMPMTGRSMSESSAFSAARVRMEDGRRSSDRLFAQIRPEAWLDRPIPERHRLLFYLGHLEAFDWNQIGPACSEAAVDEALDRLFAFGIDPAPGALPSDTVEDWPALTEVRRYVATVRRRVDEVLDRAPEIIVDIAVEHRLMHVETLTYMLHALPYDRRVVTPVAVPAETPPDHRMIEIPAGSATLGKARGSGFGWDNEFEEHRVEVDRFAVDRTKVTNARYLEFVEDGGEPSPFWIRRGDGWRWRGFDAEIPLPLDRPVYATWEQAAAFARWAGGSLPTEAQYDRYAFGAPDGAVVRAVGDGWEWTRTPFAPFPGFAPFPSYPEYSSAFFDGEHYVLKGASRATPPALVRRSFRNWFRPGYPHAYTAFRVVES